MWSFSLLNVIQRHGIEVFVQPPLTQLNGRLYFLERLWEIPLRPSEEGQPQQTVYIVWGCFQNYGSWSRGKESDQGKCHRT